MPRIISKIQHWYRKWERPVSSLSLISGFVFNALTLKRVDMFWENFWVIAHIIVIAVCIILINKQENKPTENIDDISISFWLITVLQFTTGGILSTFLVFYFRSTTLLVTWPFILLLAVAFVANESFKKQYERIFFQVSLFYIIICAFSIYIVPIFFGRIGDDVFIVSGIASLVLILLFILSLRKIAHEKFKKNKKWIMISIISILVVLNLFYFLNLIPPIPLSVKDAGIYHDISRDNQGNYITTGEKNNFILSFLLKETIHIKMGEPVYFYSAIFSPTKFNTSIIHEWQHFDVATKKWVTSSKITLRSQGGREDGFRTYSLKRFLGPGKWRVNVETTHGKVLSRYVFDLEYSDEAQNLVSETKE